jgi:3-deoxy-manno-octulosonate cytidylyltransferase (CMP-KDO synthetase)
LAVSERNASRPATLGVIPARLGSERLPRKPLYRIAGRPLIEWVWRRALALPAFDRVVVATDSEEVVAACGDFGGEVILTSAAHGSGTERVAEVATRQTFRGFDVIVNLQGDEPFVTAPQVDGAVAMVRAGWDVGTVGFPFTHLDDWREPAVVKVIRSDEGDALYFSRAPIPHGRGGEPTVGDLASSGCLRHIGVYAYTPAALARWVALPPNALERVEKLEQLRPLAAGLTIGVAVVRGGEGGIDTPADVARAEPRLRRELELEATVNANGNEVE